MTVQMLQYRFLENEKTKEMMEDFKGERTGWVQVDEKNWFFPYRYIEQGEGFFNFQVRPSDVWVTSYPRSGTTWTQELVWLLSNDLDFETAKARPLTERFPFLEFSMINHPELTKELIEYNEGDPEKQEFCRELAKPGYEVLAKISSPRFIKSHFPFSLIPNVLKSGCKIIYVARNPKDVLVSWYKLSKAFKTQGYVGDFPKFWNYFKNNLTVWSPYWEHLKEAWCNRENDVLFIFYEDMQQNLTQVIERVSSFLGKSYSPEQINKLQDHLNIENFRNNKMVNLQELKDCGIIHEDSIFVGKGLSGSWKNYFTKELEIEADEWIKKNLDDTDLRFPIINNN